MSSIRIKKEQYWRGRVAEAENHASMAAFCREEGISVSTLQYWRARFRKDRTMSKRIMPAPFLPVQVMPRSEPRKVEIDPRWLAEFILHLNRGFA